MTSTPHQTHSDFNRLLREAKPAQRTLTRLLRAAATRYNGIGVYPGAKSAVRAAEKLAEDYKGDASRLIDLARGSIVVMSLEEVDEVRDFFARHARIVRQKDRFAKPLEHGHRDLTLNVQLDCGHVCEVQIHLLEMYAFKTETHQLYKKLRRIEDGEGDAEAKQAEAAAITDRIRKMNLEATRLFNQRTTGRKLQGFGDDISPPVTDRRRMPRVLSSRRVSVVQPMSRRRSYNRLPRL